jgi:hypothetical protein
LSKASHIRNYPPLTSLFLQIRISMTVFRHADADLNRTLFEKNSAMRD